MNPQNTTATAARTLSEEQNEQLPTVIEAEGPKVDEAKVKLAKDSYEAHKKSLDGKLYAIKVVSNEGVEDLRDFMTEKAEWTGRECMGVSKLVSVLSDPDTSKVKSGFIFMNSTEVQALDYFLGKNKGTGAVSAKAHEVRVKMVGQAMRAISQDLQASEKMWNAIAGLEQGIDVNLDEFLPKEDTATEGVAKRVEA